MNIKSFDDLDITDPIMFGLVILKTGRERILASH